MALKELLARFERGEILLPLLKRYLANQQKAKMKGIVSHNMERIRDADMTIEAFKERKIEVMAKDPKDPYFHPSSLGTCMRRLYFHEFGAPGAGERTAEDLIQSHMTLEMGTYTHVMFQNLCEAAGYLKKREVGFISKKERMMGHGDGLLFISKDDLPDQDLWRQTRGEFLLEIKTINPRGFTNLREVHFGYRQQVHAYMHALGLKAALVIYIDTDRKKMREFVVMYDAAFYEEHVRQRVKRWFRHVKNRSMPDREGGGNPRTPPCAWCPFTQVCYTSEEAKKFAKKVKNLPHAIPAPKLKIKTNRKKAKKRPCEISLPTFKKGKK